MIALSIEAGDCVAFYPIYSHNTALSLHELSDLMPSKLHMTVPTGFRRSSAIPEILVLHRAHLESSDVLAFPAERVSYSIDEIVKTLRIFAHQIACTKPGVARFKDVA